MRPAATWQQRGVSLIEAVVALAVMAFGMVAVVGLQATLRGNADVSRQRAEAVRIAQQIVETRRAFSVLATTAGANAFDDVVTRPTATVAGANASYAVTETVRNIGDPRQKTLVVDVTWRDRSDIEQRVRIATQLAAAAPELVGGLATPGTTTPLQLNRGRSRWIPPAAVDQGDGTSLFTPPGSTDVSWTFSNVSGVVTRICVGGVCTDVTALLLQGFIRFATGAGGASPADAEVPPSSAFPVDVQVEQTVPAPATVSCFEQVTTGYVVYYCAMPVTSLTVGWSGRSVLTGLTLATSLADPGAASYKVCRYTPVDSDTPPGGNADHPLDYSGVTVPLANQNFLVIAAGNGSTPFACPDDDVSTPLVNGNSFRHQPLI